MKKIMKIAFVSLAALVLLASCSSFNGGGIGTFPMRDIPVDSIEDLQSGSFEILGTVTGRGDVSAKNPSDGDTKGYDVLRHRQDAQSRGSVCGVSGKRHR